MPELTIDFTEELDGPFVGNYQVPPPVNFIRALNQEGQPTRVGGPLPEPIAMDYGLPNATTVEDLTRVRDGILYAHPPHRVLAPYGRYEEGFQTNTLFVAKMRCPNLHMRAHIVTPGLDRLTPRKWVAFWFMPEDEWLAIGGLNSTPADPDFVEVVQNRLPKEPYDSIMWRHSHTPLDSGKNSWLVQGTRRRDGSGRKRNIEWEPVQDHGTLDEHLAIIDGLNFRLMARPAGGGEDAWSTVFDTSNDGRTRNIVPPDWVDKNIILAVQFADYDSGHPDKGDGAGAATRRLSSVTVRAPFVAPILDAPVPPEPEPEPEEPPTEPVEPEPEPPTEPEEPPVEPEPEPEPQPVGAVTSADLRALADWIDAGRPAGESHRWGQDE